MDAEFILTGTGKSNKFKMNFSCKSFGSLVCNEKENSIYRSKMYQSRDWPFCVDLSNFGWPIKKCDDLIRNPWCLHDTTHSLIVWFIYKLVTFQHQHTVELVGIKINTNTCICLLLYRDLLVVFQPKKHVVLIACIDNAILKRIY